MKPDIRIVSFLYAELPDTIIRPWAATEGFDEIGPDGKVEITIDTRLAKELHGDTDHRYEITAEVTDQSRRTITGQGSVLVTREPFEAYVWLDRGYYREGDTVRKMRNRPLRDRRAGNTSTSLQSFEKPLKSRPPSRVWAR